MSSSSWFRPRASTELHPATRAFCNGVRVCQLGADSGSVIPSLLRRWPTGPGWRCSRRGHILETQNLILRKPALKDFDAIRAVMDEEVVHWNDYPSSPEQLDSFAKAWIHNVKRKPYRESWVICDRSSGEVLGMRTVMSDASDSRVAATGSSLASGWRGRGLGTEELATFIGLMTHLGFRQIIASSRLDNARAISLYTKLGFTRQLAIGDQSEQSKSAWLELSLRPHDRRCKLR